eukprot:5030620-Pleurochrysis_carterae.AAC.5
MNLAHETLSSSGLGGAGMCFGLLALLSFRSDTFVRQRRLSTARARASGALLRKLARNSVIRPIYVRLQHQYASSYLRV